MNFIKNFTLQFLNFWMGLKLYQRASLSIVAVSLLIFLGFLAYKSSYTSYVPLFTAERMQNVNIEDIKKYLDNSNTPYQIRNNSIVLVPQKKENQIRADLANANLLKPPVDKGLELYDSNTWIKGEKELQILEMRALKGQLERDLSQFENISHANVILDIPTPRPFGGNNNKTKASVILSVKPGGRLSAQEVHAISLHVAGAVRGLTPNMVAISDTTGKLYQAMDPEGGLDSIRNAEMAFEEHLKAKIDGMLAAMVGFDNFYSTVQVVMSRDKIQEERKIYSGTVDGVDLGKPVVISVSDSEQKAQSEAVPPTWVADIKSKISEEASSNKNQGSQQMAVPMDYVKITSSPGKIVAISTGVLINRHFLASLPKGASPTPTGEQLKREIENQLSAILKGYNVKVNQAVDFVDFDQNRKALQPPPQTLIVTQETPDTIGWIAVGLALLALIFTALGYKKLQPLKNTIKKEKLAEDVQPLSNLETAIETLQNRYRENPQFIVSALQDWLHEEEK